MDAESDEMPCGRVKKKYIEMRSLFILLITAACGAMVTEGGVRKR